jgi:hypothetical protein
MKSNLMIAALVAMLGVCSSAYAEQDEAQHYAAQRIIAAKNKLQQAEAANGAARQALMGDHMKIMKEIMDKMTAMKPKAGMSMQEHEQWIGAHQALMQQMMDQMMGEHHLMMAK